MLTAWLLLGAMLGLQFLWLGLVFRTRTSARRDKIAQLCVYCVGVGLVTALLLWTTPEVLLPFAPVPGLLPAALIVIAALGLVLYARYQRVWPFDEECHESATRFAATHGLRTFLERYATFDWLGNQHPPLVPLLGAVLMRNLNETRFTIRLISVAACLGTLVLIVALGERLAGPSEGWWAMWFFMSMPLVWRLSSAALLDLPVTFWFVLMVAGMLSTAATGSLEAALFTGVVLGLGLLTKYVMVEGGLVVLIYLGLLEGDWLSVGAILLTAAIVFIPWVAYMAHHGILRVQFHQFQFLAGLASRRDRQSMWSLKEHEAAHHRYHWRIRMILEMLSSRLPSGIGAHNFPLIAWGLISLMALDVEPRAVLGVWLVVAFFFPIIALPDHRYMLPLFPAVALVMGQGITALGSHGLPLAAASLLLTLGNLYLYLDWSRQTHLFLDRHPKRESTHLPHV